MWNIVLFCLSFILLQVNAVLYSNGGYNVDWINGNDGTTDFFLDYAVGSNANVWIGLGFSIDNTMVS